MNVFPCTVGWSLKTGFTVLIPVDFGTIIHAHALGIGMISSTSEYQNVINQSGHPIALVSMVTTLCETRL